MYLVIFSKYVKQKVLEPRRKIDKATITAGDLNIFFYT